MRRTAILVCAVAAAAICVLRPVRSHAQAPSPLGGVWALNRALSTVPPEVGFNVAPAPGGDSGATSGSGAGGRGRRGSGGGGSRSGGAVPVVRESYLDGQRLRLATTEARNPPSRLVIVDNPGAVTLTTELGESRTFHPNGREESIEIQATPINITASRDGDRLIVRYHVEPTRDVQYTFSRSANPPQLIVDLELLEKGTAGDKARLIYEPGLDTGTRTAPPAAASPSPPGAPAAPAGSGSSQPRDTFDARPGAEFRGLKTLGILVEDLSAQAIACGLNHDTLEAALAKRLTDGGFSVRRNSDDDTYLYVNVMTTSANGTCTSRFDAFLYTTATANLSYRDRPALVQVSLIHRGGMASSAAVTHAATIGRGLEAYVDTFMTQIRDANK
jgi:hypothetical protein